MFKDRMNYLWTPCIIMYNKLIFLYIRFCNLGYYLTVLYIESLAIDKQSSDKIMKTKAYHMYPKVCHPP